MARGLVDRVVVGADRIAGNGDAANKIGTYTVAVLAHRHGVPFYVAAPRSTIDLATPSGAEIPIEERRAASEVKSLGGVAVAPERTGALNFAFDVTPAELIAAIITEEGVHYAALRKESPRPPATSYRELLRAPADRGGWRRCRSGSRPVAQALGRTAAFPGGGEAAEPVGLAAAAGGEAAAQHADRPAFGLEERGSRGAAFGRAELPGDPPVGAARGSRRLRGKPVRLGRSTSSARRWASVPGWWITAVRAGVSSSRAVPAGEAGRASGIRPDGPARAARCRSPRDGRGNGRPTGKICRARRRLRRRSGRGGNPTSPPPRRRSWD